MAEHTTAHAKYEELKKYREPYLRRARECARVTLPYLFPPEGSSGTTDLPTPFQSVGSRGVNTLASKLLLALFPPNSPFFELTVDDFVVSEMEQESGNEDLRGDLNKALASITRAVVEKFDTTRSRNRIFDLLKNLIVGGNGLLEILEDDSILVHALPNYVVKRDGEGHPKDIVLLRKLSRRTAPQDILDLLDEPTAMADQEDESAEDTINLYTWIRRDGKKWKVHQEVGDNATKVPDSDGTYPLDKPAFIPLRFIAVEGEDYGRSFAEEYLGDLYSLEKGTRSIVEFSAVASRILTFVDPSGTTDPDDVTEGSSGDVLEGDARDVTILGLEKFPDFRITDAVVQRMEDRLEKAFLLMSGIQRQAERVTAEEIRRLAEELEESLGGVYSLLAGELQAPLAQRLMHQMTKRDELPSLPKEDVNMKVTTGVAAIGRNHDLIKIDTFIRGMLEVGDQRALDYLKLGNLWKRRAAAINLPVDDLVRTDEEVQQMQQQRQMAEAATKAAPQAVKAAGDRANAEAAANQPTQE